MSASPRDASEVRRYKYYDWFLIAFVSVLLISNIVGPKIVGIGQFRIGAAQALFPFTYIFGDVFTEVYGYSSSRRAIWSGFFASFLMVIFGQIVLWLPPHPDFKNQAAFETVLGAVPRFVAASLVAYWCGEFANSFVMAKMKLWSQGRHLWMRTIGSTAVGQMVDSIVFMAIAFTGTYSLGAIASLIISSYGTKVIYEVVMTPVTYAVVNWLKRAEGVDIYDHRTDFNPFHLAENKNPA
ncbi:MAG: queuosine precursor transporter [Bryobacteraceae bacterium]|nr:queuosine precursor transporter [Bryobacteraceae bacterium]